MTLELVHDMKNPLGSLSLNVAMLHRVLQRAESLEGTALDDARTLASEALSTLEHLHRIAKDVRTVAAQPARAVRVAVDDEVSMACRLAESSLRGRAELRREPETGAYLVSYPGSICRLTLNLILNAAESIPEGGNGGHEVRVCTRRLDDAVLILVSDTGCGIDEEMQARIFEPFFSTKNGGDNRGLGLASVSRIAERHAGSVRVESSNGAGSTFEVRLPFESELREGASA